MTDTIPRETLLDRLRGPSYEQKELWLEARRQGVTATEVRDLAKGNGADRRRIKIEKLTGERPELVGNQYIDRGNEREPIIAAWIDENFDIAPNDHVFIDASIRALCTPDGISRDFADDGILAEIKTSKHDLTPAAHAMEAPRILVPGIATLADKGGHFWKTGYYDQMQWQMLVLRAERTLFVWEQHDSNWPNPQPVTPEPQWCWVMEDNERQMQLFEIAQDFLQELDSSRPSDVPTVGTMGADIAELTARVLHFRNAEAVAKAAKEDAWKELQEKLLVEGAPDVQLENDTAKLSVTTTTKPVAKLDEAAMRAKAPRLVAQYEALVERYTKHETKTTRSLSVVAKKTTN